jgi:hypothetical protein
MIGRELAVPRHLLDGEEFVISLQELIRHGKLLFNANWTAEDGGGRPLSKGTGRALADPNEPLVGKRAFNRISGPDANACVGCHNTPYGISGGGGDFAANVFVLGQRFDFVTFDPSDSVPTKGALDERSARVKLSDIANLRASPGMFGAGYIEMLAREITEDLQTIRNSIRIGESRVLVSKGIQFGRLARRTDGTWDATGVVGLPRLSVLTPTPLDPPSLIVRPWHQAGNVVSLREFSNTALNHHHGIQSTERFGVGTDPDGDGVTDEATRADVTALAIYQAVLQVPGRVIPRDPGVEQAVLRGEAVFNRIGCGSCHVPALPLSRKNWSYTEPNPFNPATNLRVGETHTLSVNLMDATLPLPRLAPNEGDQVVMVPVFTDFKLHDITDPQDEDVETLDMNQNVNAPKFASGNRKFLTKRLWGCANEPPFFHHGLFTTLRQAVLAHHGEALKERKAFQALEAYEQDSLIEFLKTLQVLPPGTNALVVDEDFKPREWPPATANGDKPKQH